ncbi:MAG: EamA family transporter [Tissierellia bacterium]|nr:EamA family transporter [Tissierellia bacterium]
MSPVQFLAIATIGSGLVLLAYFEYKDQKEGRLRKSEIAKLGASALIFPITYMLVDAVATFLDEHYMTSIMNETEALISFELTFFLVGVLSLIYLFFVKKHRYNPFKPTLLLGGISETAGQFFYVFALAGDGVVTAPIMSLDGVVASLFGVLLLKERIRKRQKLTILLIAVAVFVLGFFE